jgi:hypothetical protein
MAKTPCRVNPRAQVFIYRFALPSRTLPFTQTSDSLMVCKIA